MAIRISYIVWPHLLNWGKKLLQILGILNLHIFVYRSIVRDDEGVILIAPPGSSDCQRQRKNI